MKKNKNRLFLVVVLAIAAGFLISTKINNLNSNKLTPSNISTEANNPVEAPASDTNTDGATVTKQQPQEAYKPNNYLVKVPECLNIEVTSKDSLKSISDQNRWMNKDPKNLIRQNLIYKNENKEFRISISPSDSKNTWLLQSFDVDSEGLPIPKNKTMDLRYDQLSEKIKTESKEFSLVSDEQNILVDSPNISGSILYINGEPVEIKLFNKSNQRLLECQESYCVCNQALSS